MRSALSYVNLLLSNQMRNMLPKNSTPLGKCANILVRDDLESYALKCQSHALSTTPPSLHASELTQLYTDSIYT